MGEWHKYESPNHPCTNCQMGWGSASSEMRDGELWTKYNDCHETCQILKDYTEQSLAGVLRDGEVVLKGH